MKINIPIASMILIIVILGSVYYFKHFNLTKAKPVECKTFSDEVLGTLSWDSKIEWWNTKLKTNSGQTFDLAINVGEKDLGETLIFARNIFQKIKQSDEYYKSQAADRLLKIYNESWSESKEIDKKTFMEKITIHTVVVYKDGEINIYYNDGNLFLGHTILINVNPDETISDATIAG